jgi:hypothetical protein
MNISSRQGEPLLKVISLLLLSAFLTSDVCFAQRVFYYSKRDAQAQVASEVLKDVLSGRLFEAQLKNLEQLGTQQLETVIRWQEGKMRAIVDGFTKWSDVIRVGEGIEYVFKGKTVDANLVQFFSRRALAGGTPSRFREGVNCHLRAYELNCPRRWSAD